MSDYYSSDNEDITCREEMLQLFASGPPRPKNKFTSSVLSIYNYRPSNRSRYQVKEEEIANLDTYIITSIEHISKRIGKEHLEMNDIKEYYTSPENDIVPMFCANTVISKAYRNKGNEIPIAYTASKRPIIITLSAKKFKIGIQQINEPKTEERKEFNNIAIVRVFRTYGTRIILLDVIKPADRFKITNIYGITRDNSNNLTIDKIKDLDNYVSTDLSFEDITTICHSMEEHSTKLNVTIETLSK